MVSLFLFRPKGRLTATVAGSRGVQQFTKEKANDIVDAARKEFLRQVKHTHGITPPPYANSFFVAPKPGTNDYMAGNSDPAVIMVEFGAHPGGGSTQVLKYHPFARGIEVVSATR